MLIEMGKIRESKVGRHNTNYNYSVNFFGIKIKLLRIIRKPNGNKFNLYMNRCESSRILDKESKIQ